MACVLLDRLREIAFAAPRLDGSGYPAVSDAVARARRAGARRVAVAWYLLADGLFQGRLGAADADVVAAPLGLHPAVIRLACERRRAVRLLESWVRASIRVPSPSGLDWSAADLRRLGAVDRVAAQLPFR